MSEESIKKVHDLIEECSRQRSQAARDVEFLDKQIDCLQDALALLENSPNDH